jgi:hypothetical protein
MVFLFELAREGRRLLIFDVETKLLCEISKLQVVQQVPGQIYQRHLLPSPEALALSMMELQGLLYYDWTQKPELRFVPAGSWKAKPA